MGFKNFHSCKLPSYAEGMDNSVIWECDECEKKYQAQVDIHWGHVSWNEIPNDDEKETEEIDIDTDLAGFLNLYKNIGIVLETEKVEDGFYVQLTVGDFGNKVIGYNYHYTGILFDDNGKFIKQIIRD